MRRKKRDREMVWYVTEVESVLVFMSCSRDGGVIKILGYDERRSGGGICEKDDLI